MASASSVPTNPEAIATLIDARTNELLGALAARFSEFQQAGQREPAMAVAPARPRVLSAIYCLAAETLGAGSGARGGDSLAAYLAAVRQALKRLHPDWRGPFSFESTVQQGAGLYLRDAPNLTELVRSKPDYVFEEEVHRAQSSDDRLALFALKAKIQILESMRIRTHEAAHVPLGGVIEEFIRRTAEELRAMRAG